MVGIQTAIFFWFKTSGVLVFKILKIFLFIQSIDKQFITAYPHFHFLINPNLHKNVIGFLSVLTPLTHL